MKFKQLKQLIEELTSVQKNEVDSWGPNTRATEISKHVFPKGHDRIEIPLEHGDEKPIEPHPQVHAHLKQHGYEVKDYGAGIATDKHGRDVKIGKALEKTKAPDELKNAFVNDPNRAAKKSGDLKVVISKHSHDVAGMSTDRGWNSCMNMKGGCNRHYLKKDIENGTHVAYLVHKDDNDIKKPLARIALKPYHGTSSGHTVLRPEETGYGTSDSAFHNTVKKFTDKHYPTDKDAVYRKNDRVYHDSGDGEIVGNLEKAVIHINPSIRSIAARHPDLTKEHIDKLINDPSDQVKINLMKHKNLTSEHIDKLIDRRPDIIASRNDLTPEHINKIIDMKHARNAHLNLIDKNKNLTSDQIDKLIDHGDEDVNMTLAKSKNLTDKHIDKLVNSDSHSVRYQMLQHNKLKPKHLDKLLNDEEGYVAIAALKHPNLTKDQKDKIIHGDDHTLKFNLAKSENISDEQINEMLKDKDLAYPLTFNPNLKKEHIDKLIEHKNKDVNYHISNRRDLTPDQIHKLIDNDINTEPSGVSRNLLSANLNNDHLEKLLKHKDPNVRYNMIHQRKDLSPEHINKLANDKNSDVRQALVYSHRLSKEQYLKMLRDPNEDHYVKDSVKAQMKRHYGISQEDIDQMLNIRKRVEQV